MFGFMLFEVLNRMKFHGTVPFFKSIFLTDIFIEIEVSVENFNTFPKSERGTWSAVLLVN